MSNLPPLSWKYIDQYAIPQISQSSVNGWLDGIFTLFNRTTYADGTSRVTGSGVAWSFFRTSSFVNGVTDAVYGYPPTMSIVSQSVIFAGTASSTTIIPTMSSTFLTNTYVTNSLYVALQKNSNWKAYTHWTSASIFNSSSVNINTVSSSGYSLLVKNEIISQSVCDLIQAWESGEAIFVALKSTGSYIGNPNQSIYTTNNKNNLSLVIAGAFIDSLSDDTTYDSEVDGRIYGVCADSGSNTTRVLSDNTSYRFLRGNAIFYRPGYLTSDPNYLIKSGHKFHLWNAMTNSSKGPQISTDVHSGEIEEEYSYSGKRILYPIAMYEMTDRNNFVGILRKIYLSTKITPPGTTLISRNTQQTIGYTIGLDTNNYTDFCYLLKS